LLKYSQLSLEDVYSAIQAEDSSSSDADAADAIAEALQCHKSPSSSDTNSGAMARSVVRSTRCEHCKQELNGDGSVDVDECVESVAPAPSTLLDSIDRRGLSRPSDYAFLLAVHCWQVFEEVKSNEELKTKFLGAVSQKSLFLKIMDRVSDTSFATENCMKGHSLKSLLVQRLLNCFAKNFVKELSAQVQNCQQPPKKRKIAKLTGETHC